MPRQKKCRKICAMPRFAEFSPKDHECVDIIFLGIDEYETIRLIDMQKLTQEQCAERMQISRTTVTGIYDSARTKLADALVNGKRLVISGGYVELGALNTTVEKEV